MADDVVRIPMLPLDNNTRALVIKTGYSKQMGGFHSEIDWDEGLSIPEFMIAAATLTRNISQVFDDVVRIYVVDGQEGPAEKFKQASQRMSQITEELANMIGTSELPTGNVTVH